VLIVCSIFAGYILVVWLLWFYYPLRNNNFETPSICGQCFYPWPSSAALVSASRSDGRQATAGPCGTWIDSSKRQYFLRFSISSELPVALNQPSVRRVQRIKRPELKAGQRHIAAWLWVSGAKSPHPHINSWSVRGQLCFRLYLLCFLWRQGH